MLRIFFGLIFVIVSSVSGWAQGFPLSEIEVQRSGAWSGGLFLNERLGDRLCVARTTSNSGQEFRIYALDDGRRFAEIIDPAFRRFQRGSRVEVGIRFERGAATVVALANGTIIGWGLNPGFEDFVELISERNRMEMVTRGGDFLSDISLSGSSEAVRALLLCIQTMR